MSRSPCGTSLSLFASERQSQVTAVRTDDDACGPSLLASERPSKVTAVRANDGPWGKPGTAEVEAALWAAQALSSVGLLLDEVTLGKLRTHLSTSISCARSLAPAMPNNCSNRRVRCLFRHLSTSSASNSATDMSRAVAMLAQTPRKKANFSGCGCAAQSSCNGMPLGKPVSWCTAPTTLNTKRAVGLETSSSGETSQDTTSKTPSWANNVLVAASSPSAFTGSQSDTFRARSKPHFCPSSRWMWPRRSATRSCELAPSSVRSRRSDS
mmetsp:Transcript_82141/g.214408  ORF Transcript_82141/g.214408 Transcript_82141/m.214408 type:complete len:268 (+) Transcript_82141:390-1193(+)